MTNLIPTDREGLFRKNGSVVNTDKGALESYKKAKSFNKRILIMQDDIENLKLKNKHLEEMIEYLMEKING